MQKRLKLAATEMDALEAALTKREGDISEQTRALEANRTQVGSQIETAKRTERLAKAREAAVSKGERDLAEAQGAFAEAQKSLKAERSAVARESDELERRKSQLGSGAKALEQREKELRSGEEALKAAQAKLESRILAVERQDEAIVATRADLEKRAAIEAKERSERPRKRIAVGPRCAQGRGHEVRVPIQRLGSRRKGTCIGARSPRKAGIRIRGRAAGAPRIQCRDRAGAKGARVRSQGRGCHPVRSDEQGEAA